MTCWILWRRCRGQCRRVSTTVTVSPCAWRAPPHIDCRRPPSSLRARGAFISTSTVPVTTAYPHSPRVGIVKNQIRTWTSSIGFVGWERIEHLSSHLSVFFCLTLIQIINGSDFWRPDCRQSTVGYSKSNICNLITFEFEKNLDLVWILNLVLGLNLNQIRFLKIIWIWVKNWIYIFGFNPDLGSKTFLDSN